MGDGGARFTYRSSAFFREHDDAGAKDEIEWSGGLIRKPPSPA
jgi:hypothetical protein